LGARGDYQQREGRGGARGEWGGFTRWGWGPPSFGAARREGVGCSREIKDRKNRGGLFFFARGLGPPPRREGLPIFGAIWAQYFPGRLAPMMTTQSSFPWRSLVEEPNSVRELKGKGGAHMAPGGVARGGGQCSGGTEPGHAHDLLLRPRRKAKPLRISVGNWGGRALLGGGSPGS